MKIIFVLYLGIIWNMNIMFAQDDYKFSPAALPVSYEEADRRADEILSKMTLEEKIEMIGGHNYFFVKGFEKYGIPQLYLSDATQGVHIRKNLPGQMEKSTAFPCPIALTATWNIELANKYAQSVGEECRAGGIAVLLAPGMNIYRISQNGRNFEYFGEDPFLAARMIENYVAGVQSTGTMATLKHFCLNNTEHFRRTSNSIADERTIHEIYLPAFKAGIDAGAMAVMTSYNLINGEWAAQSENVISKLLRNDLGFTGLVMSDWWSTYDPLKVINSGLDLEMPGHPVTGDNGSPDHHVRSSAIKLLNDGKITEQDINRMVKNILRSCIRLGIYDRPIKDESLLTKFLAHENIALQTARESIVLLRNENNILPIQKDKEQKILFITEYADKIPGGGGSAAVDGYNNITILDALKSEFGKSLNYSKDPTEQEIKGADIVLLHVVTLDSEGTDRFFNLPADVENIILKITSANPNTIVIVNSGSGINMSGWNEKAAAIIYSWYPGQNGNQALAEIISGKVNPSGKLPITIEKKFEDSPGYPYTPEGVKLQTTWADDFDTNRPITDINYKEGIFVGYRWYESKNINPLYPFGFGLSYTQFDYSDIKTSSSEITNGEQLMVEFTIKNSGKFFGAEVAQLYIQDIEASVPRPIKELKGFKKVFLNAGESKTIKLTLSEKDFAYWDVDTNNWYAEPGEYNILIGSASNSIKLKTKIVIK